MTFKEVTNLRTGRKTFYVAGSDDKLVRVSGRRYRSLDNGGNYNSAVAWTENGRRYFCHAR